MYDWLIGNSYGMLPAQDYTNAKSYLRMKVAIPSEEEVAPHLTYLYSLIDDNAPNTRNEDESKRGKFLATRTGVSYSLRVYNATTEQWHSTINDRWIGISSNFPTFYLSEDALLTERFDISSLGENVKAAMAETFNKFDLSDVYTETELDILGIPELPEPEGSTFVAGGNTYVLMDSTEVINNKTYYGVLSTASKKAAGWGHYKSYVEYLTDKTAGSTGDIPVTLYMHNDYNGDPSVANAITDIQTYATYFEPMSDYIAPSTTEWIMCTSNSAKLYYTGSIGIPTKEQYSSLIAANPDVITLGSSEGLVTNSYSWWDTYYYSDTRKLDGTAAKRFTLNDKNGVASNGGGTFYFMTYVSEDFFLNTKLDIAETSVKVREMLSNHYQYEFAPGLYSDKEYDVLGIEPFGEESKSATDASNSFVVGGENYLISSNIVEENGKKYFLVMNSTHLATDAGPYGRIEESVFDSEASTDTIKIFSDFKLGADYGNLEKTPTQKFKGSRSMADEYQDIYFPSSVFGDNLKMHDWQMATGWTWSDDNKVDVYHRAYMGLPTVEEVNAFNAIDPLSTQYTPLVETRTFTDNWNWKRMHLANLNGGDTSSGSIVGADNFAYKENGQGKFFFVAYVSEDFFKGTDIDMATAGDGFKSIVKANFERAELTGWTKANLDLLFAGYDGEGLGLEVAKTANGAEVIVHNNGTEADGYGATIIVAAYEDGCFKGFDTMTLSANVSANAKTVPFKKFDLEVTENTEIKAMLWGNVSKLSAITSAVSVK